MLLVTTALSTFAFRSMDGVLSHVCSLPRNPVSVVVFKKVFLRFIIFKIIFKISNFSSRSNDGRGGDFTGTLFQLPLASATLCEGLFPFAKLFPSTAGLSI